MSVSGTNAKCSDVHYLVGITGKNGRRGHRVFVDAEVIRGGPLRGVAGHGREAWRAAPGSARLL